MKFFYLTRYAIEFYLHFLNVLVTEYKSSSMYSGFMSFECISTENVFAIKSWNAGRDLFDCCFVWFSNYLLNKRPINIQTQHYIGKIFEGNHRKRSTSQEKI